DIQPFASEYVPQMIEKIDKLLKNGFAYHKEDGIYFNSTKIDYGKFEKRELKEKEADFALWKFCEDESINQIFDSKFGKGTPGWHIECTTMSYEILKDFDIHGGGIDLKYPHHENEIAQAEGLYEKIPSIWIHNEMINIKGDKMSKSLGNFWFIKDIIKNSFDADVFRYLVLSHHFQSIIEISEEKFYQARETMKNIRIFYLNNTDKKIFNKEIDPKIVFSSLYNNFESPQLLNEIFSYIKNNDIETLDFILKSLGFFMHNLCNLSMDEINSLINERNIAKNSKDYKKSDELRKILEDNFVGIRDNLDKTTWYYF
ncbi:MAG: class I tRNA ligase family protein, partial [Bacteroidota bacterium]